MDLLTAVNRILPKLGEHPVTSLNVKHPTLAILLPAIDNKSEDVQIVGYWFNTFDITLYPDSEKAIAMPSDTLSFVPRFVDAIQRGTRLYNPENMTYLWDSPVEGTLIQLIPFEELPESAASYIFYSALIVAFATDLGVTDELRVWQAEAGAAERRMMSEHLRNKKYSTRRSPRYQRLRRVMRA